MCVLLPGSKADLIIPTRVARFFSTQYTKTWENISNCHKITKWPYNVPNGLNIFKMAKECTKLFHSKALQNLPKLGFLVWKQTIWQPWFQPILHPPSQPSQPTIHQHLTTGVHGKFVNATDAKKNRTKIGRKSDENRTKIGRERKSDEKSHFRVRIQKPVVTYDLGPVQCGQLC
jgi:hypothetical protein